MHRESAGRYRPGAGTVGGPALRNWLSQMAPAPSIAEQGEYGAQHQGGGRLGRIIDRHARDSEYRAGDGRSTPDRGPREWVSKRDPDRRGASGSRGGRRKGAGDCHAHQDREADRVQAEVAACEVTPSGVRHIHRPIEHTRVPGCPNGRQICGEDSGNDIGRFKIDNVAGIRASRGNDPRGEVENESVGGVVRHREREPWDGAALNLQYAYGRRWRDTQVTRGVAVYTRDKGSAP